MAAPTIASIHLRSSNRFGWWSRATALAAILILIVIGWLSLRFGSLRTARAYLRGQVVEVSLTPAIAGPGTGRASDANEITASFKNNSLHPITVIGAFSSCHCIEIYDLPVVLPPLSNGGALKAVVKPTTVGTVRRAPLWISFVTDSPLMPEVAVVLQF